MSGEPQVPKIDREEIEEIQRKKIKIENKNSKEEKTLFEKIWFILWKDNSFKGWIISLIFLLIVIRGIFFPILSLATGTTIPLVIVESCSMYHSGNLFSDFDSWWTAHEEKYTEKNITKNEFLNFHFKNGLNKGDILFVTAVKPEDVKFGDILIFDSGAGTPIIHRVIKITNENGIYTFSTQGDNNNGQLGVEKSINEDRVVGKPRANILPYVGWIKLIFFEGGKPESERGLCNEN
ncbi:signal peptidase I [Candidatus Pacearchaeota archaeon]|nr:hypothetical protein [uncultured archaeon]MBS3084522.1 signal peptidase I [Candidatus Pacearchaeota archaeon]